jgi:hypothetical protein
MISFETRTVAPAIELQLGISNVMARRRSRPLSSIQMTGDTMVRTIAGQSAQLPAAAGVNRIYGIVGDGLGRTNLGRSGKLS